MLTIDLPGCTYFKAVTPDDTADNIKDGIYLQNVGTSGAITIRQSAGYGNVSTYLVQGDAIRILKYWHGAMSTGLGAGVDLRVFR